MNTSAQMLMALLTVLAGMDICFLTMMYLVKVRGKNFNGNRLDYYRVRCRTKVCNKNNICKEFGLGI